MTWLKVIAATTMMVGAACSGALAQKLPEGRVYSFHSGAQGACPGLDWHVVANGSALEGMIS